MNKYILNLMKFLENMPPVDPQTSYIDADTAYATYIAGGYTPHDSAAYLACYAYVDYIDAVVVSSSKIKREIDEYFRWSDENKQDYLNAIEESNNE